MHLGSLWPLQLEPRNSVLSVRRCRDSLHVGQRASRKQASFWLWSSGGPTARLCNENEAHPWRLWCETFSHAIASPLKTPIPNLTGHHHCVTTNQHYRVEDFFKEKRICLIGVRPSADDNSFVASGHERRAAFQRHHVPLFSEGFFSLGFSKGRIWRGCYCGLHLLVLPDSFVTCAFRVCEGRVYIAYLSLWLGAKFFYELKRSYALH